MGLDETRWQQLVLCATALTPRGPKGDLHLFIAAVAWILRTGAPWRDLAERYGRWHRIYRRYRRWAVAGRWDSLRRALSSRDAKGMLRAYDSDAFIAHVKSLRMRAVIPSRCGRRRPRRLDRVRYAQRNVIERWFGRVKMFRRIATRYEKTSTSYAGFVAAAATLVLVTGWPG